PELSCDKPELSCDKPELSCDKPELSCDKPVALNCPVISRFLGPFGPSIKF
ncbi:hypothetical protein L9F63_009882, partial [Diploptera punctata]